MFDQEVFIFNRAYSEVTPDFSIPVHSMLLNRISYLFYRLAIPLKNELIAKSILHIYRKKNLDVIHSHTWFSGGGAALLINKRKNINYIVTVRNSDIHSVWKYYPWFRDYGIEILLKASKIICPTPVIKKKILKMVNSNVNSKINKKIIIIPNGIDSFWLDKQPEPKQISKYPYQLLFVGELAFNKNIHRLIQLLKDNSKIKELKIVGGDKGKIKNIVYTYLIQLYTRYYNIPIKWVGEINDKIALRDLYKKSDIFIMVSKKETFGLTYIESLSQGTPIIYTKGQGVDGFFNKQPVGFGVCENDLNGIFTNINKIEDNYNELSANSINQSKNFNWRDISLKMNKIYKERDMNV
jgi:glycosyltransferase involved in cell wall biosynthesis